MAEHVISRKIYLVVWAALMAFMILTAGLSRINLGEWSTVVALLIAAIKALLVILFFMHVRYEHQKIAWVLVIAGFFAVLLLALSMIAQVQSGNVSGTVTDPSGAVVPGATVTVKSSTTGLTRTATTSSNGGYTINNLPPGPYDVKVSASGFGNFTG